MPIAVSLSLALVLAFHPYSTSAPAAYLRAAPEEPADGVQPGWDDIVGPDAIPQPPDPTLPATGAPESTPAPAPIVAAKPEYKKGTGLMIGAGVTGGLAWILGLTRMAFVKQCSDKLTADIENVPTGLEAVNACAFKAGVAGAVLGIFQVPLNWATWGLGAGAGSVRGRYDGVEDAWDKTNAKKTAAFIGAGAAVLAVGIVGRITAGVMVFRPYKNFATEVEANPDDVNAAVDKLSRGIRGRLFGLQLSSAMIAGGAGLLAYGIAYRKNFDSENRRMQQVRLAPQFSRDRASGSSYTGLSLSGRF